MASVITIAGEQLFAAKAQANEQLDIDTFIFANVPNQDPNAPINREEGIPTAHIVYQQNVQQVGRINDNVVVYSTVLDSITGPFEFNWVGLYSSVNQKLVAINHVPTVTKTATAQGAAGNTLNRNFGIEYSGIAELTGITVDAGTWQLDFTARLSGMDLLTQQLAADMNGKDWFIDDGLKVVPRTTANSFSVTPGVGYVSGLRVELKQEHILIVQSYPQFVYVDAWFSGNANSTWSPQLAFTVTNGEMDDYVDPSGAQHYVYKLAVINEVESADDLRKQGLLLDQVYNSSKEYTVEEITNGKSKKTGEIFRVVDRCHELFILKNGGSANGIDIINAGNGKVAQIYDYSGIKSAKSFGAKLDWNGETGTDETAIFKRLHELGVNYSMDGKFSHITETLPLKSNQKVYFFGGGFNKQNSGYILSTNNQKIDNFIGYNGYFTGGLKADLIDMSGVGSGYPDSCKNIKLIDCNAAQMYVLFNMDNARACQIVRGRYAGHTAIQYTNKSAECAIMGALLIKDEAWPTKGIAATELTPEVPVTKGIHSFAGDDGYPEGLTVTDCLIFRFYHNLAIDDLYIGKIDHNYIDSGDDADHSYIAYGDKTEGVDIDNNWFYMRGIVIGKTGEILPRQFRSNITNNHFNNMITGTDITLKRWSHGVTITGNQHNSDGEGSHVCVVCEGNNNGIIIDTINPLGYTQYVQMKIDGENNSISNIPNVDNLSSPISLDYPVNIYNVEGYFSLVEGPLIEGTFNGGDVISSADNIILSSGLAHLSFDIGRVNIAGDGFLKVVAYKAGTFDIDENVIIAGVSGFNSYSSGDRSIRFGFPVAVKKATKSTFAVIVENGSAAINGGSSVTDGLIVMQ